VDQLGDLRADPGRLGDLLGRGGQQRVDRAELLRETAPGHVAHALDPERVEHDGEGPLAAGLEGAEQAIHADLAVTLQLE
jgi:hypothetical protein